MKSMSSRSSSVDLKYKHESEYLEFLLKLIKNAGGSLRLQQITRHLSQLSYDVTSTIGTSKSDLLHFLKKHSTIFSINDDIVKIDDSSKNCSYDSDSSSIETQSELPSKIKKGKGVIISLFPKFGFIKAKEPVKTVVYFKSLYYENKDIDLTSSLYVGAMVYFNATKKDNDDSRSKYFGTKVWKVDKKDIPSSIVVKKSRKSRDSGLYDPMTLDGEGVIQNIFPNLGFITVKGEENNTVFFHKNRLLKYDNIVDLTKVLSKGDIVEFSAHRSTKKDSKVRWEATKVWKKSNLVKETCDSTESGKNVGNHSSVSKRDMQSKYSTKEMIKDQRGKICPRSHGAVIKFGQNELADGDASVYYISGCEVKDIGWEFSEGDNVFFDAVKIKSAPGWKAVLVWVGEKPDIVLPTCLGDFSEFTDDETEDNLSSYMSYSSNSSVKSECSSFKNRNSKKETSSVSSFSVDIKNKRRNFKEKLQHPFSPHSSQSSLNSSVTSKSSQRSKNKHNNEDNSKYLSAKNKAVSCWGDSPYPDDDDCNNIASDSYNYNLASNSNNKILKVPNKDIHSKKEHLGSVEENIDRIEINERNLISESKAKETANIIKHKNIEGKIINLYSKFAEFKAKGVETKFSFFWNNFYINGKYVEESELEDLREVLKIGDTIYFNYFEIVDDTGHKWDKVSLAWKDSKPVKVTEITPEDFIKQNNLSVNSKTVVDNQEEDNAVHRKYLTAVRDLDADELVDNTSSDSCTEDESLISADQSDISKQPNNFSLISADQSDISKQPNNISLISADQSDISKQRNKILSVDYKMMSRAVTEILKKGFFSSDSEVDFNCIAEEIINVVLENHDPRKCDSKFCETLLQNENCINMTSNSICVNCGELFTPNCDKGVNAKNSDVQTIITGEIIAQNIFTEC